MPGKSTHSIGHGIEFLVLCTDRFFSFFAGSFNPNRLSTRRLTVCIAVPAAGWLVP